MSPSWRDRILVGLEADRITALRLARGWHPRIVDRRDIALVDSSNDVLQASLQSLLSEPGWNQGTVEIILAEHHVRYVMVTAERKLKSQADRTAFANILFGQTYGDMAREWTVAVSPASLSQPTIASGVNKSLLQAIRSSCTTGRLHSIQPGLMRLFNQSRKTIGTNSGTLAVVEPGRITLAGIAAGRWQSIRSRAVNTEDPEALVRHLGEETQFHPSAASTTLWLSDLTAHQQLPGTPWHVVHLAPVLPKDAPVPTPGLLGWALA